MIKNKLIYFFLAGTFLTACSDNEAPAIDPKAYPLVIKAKVYNSYDTEQEGVTWTKPEDIIGVYVLKSGSSEVVSPHAYIYRKFIFNCRNCFLVFKGENKRICRI